MDCESNDKQHHYRVRLAFDENWDNTDENPSIESSLKDVFFDVFEAKTNKRINRLGKNSREKEKFSVLLTIAAGRSRVALQLKPEGGQDQRQWTEITCQTINLVANDISGVDVSANIRHDTKDFKTIEFELKETEEKSLKYRKQSFRIKAGESNFKWGKNFDPKIVFTRI